MRSFGSAFRPFRLAVGVVIFAVLAVMLGCATASGSLFESEVSAPTERRVRETEPDDTTAEDEDDEEEEKVGLAIRTSPHGADVFIDGRMIGTSPLRRELATGRYHIVVEKDGYRPAELFVSHVRDQYQEVRLELEEILGRVFIDVVPPDATVRTGFRSITPGRETELRIGVYPLAVSAFGYETHRESIVVMEGRTTAISVVLEEAPFRVDSFTARVDHFSPTDPGLLGSASFRIAVSGPGDGEYRVVDSTGRVVSDLVPIRFTERSTTVRWNGRDTDGSPLPDGEYTIVFTGENGVHEKHLVSIDRTITRRARTVFGGAAGTLFSPLPASLPRGMVQPSVIALGHAGALGYMIPVVGSLRVGVADREEVVVSGGAIVRGPSGPAGDSIVFASVSWSMPAFHTAFAASSAIVKASYVDSREVDPISNTTGVSGAFPVAASIGPLSIVATPELVIGAGDLGGAGGAFGQSGFFRMTAYARAAAVLDLGPLSFALSGALRNRVLPSGIVVEWPVNAGAELHVTFPNLLLAFSSAGALRWDPTSGWYIFSGGGIAVLIR